MDVLVCPAQPEEQRPRNQSEKTEVHDAAKVSFRAADGRHRDRFQHLDRLRSRKQPGATLAGMTGSNTDHVDGSGLVRLAGVRNVQTVMKSDNAEVLGTVWNEGCREVRIANASPVVSPV